MAPLRTLGARLASSVAASSVAASSVAASSVAASAASSMAAPAPGPPPLAGLRVLEFAGLAPGPYAGMLLADAGAHANPDLLARRKASVAVDLKRPRGAALVCRLAAAADVLVDPFRPGVLERLGLGPAPLLAANPRLVYARLSGFCRDGRYAAMAGHDINYLTVSGALGLLGPAAGPPRRPANLLADFAGGGAVLVHGVLLALLARAASGRGQVVEANMVEGASYVASFARLMRKTPLGDRGRGRNLLDGGSPYYDVYATADGRFVSVGALEPRFFAALLRGLGLDGRGWEARRDDPAQWPALRRAMAAAFRRRTRAEWECVFDGSDACCLPVLDYAELEADAAREGDQRPPVALHATPCLAIRRRAGADSAGAGFAGPDSAAADCAAAGSAAADSAAVRGQGPGVPGDGYEAPLLAPGDGGEAALDAWLGWAKGVDYDVSDDAGFTWREELEPEDMAPAGTEAKL